MADDHLFLSTGDVAKLANVAPATVVSWEKTGKLAAIRTAGGVRLFEQSAVDHFIVERQRQAKAPELAA